MPSLDEFLNKPEPKKDHSHLENVDGIRPCAYCDEDVDGAIWDPNDLVLTWVCTTSHVNSFKVN